MKLKKHIYYYEGRGKQKFSYERNIDGRRVSRRFTTLADAEDFANELALRLHEDGADSLFLESEDKKMLKHIRERYGDIDLFEAARFWHESGMEKSAESPDLNECWMEFIAWLEKAGRSDDHIKSITSAYHHFMAQFRGRSLRSIRRQDLIDWIFSKKDLAPRTKKNLWANTRNFLSWCCGAKCWIASVPKIDDRLFPRVVKKPVEIWSYEEAEAAMRWIEQNAPEYIPFYALRLFAGLRTSEAQRMRWEWIDIENRRITVPAAICKTRDAWVILPDFLPDTVFHWLKPFGRKKGDIKSPSNRLADKIAKACAWKQNVMRHTFATMHVALYHDEGKTILATRHTDIATLRAHYRGVNQTQEEAQKFFALRPAIMNSRRATPRF